MKSNGPCGSLDCWLPGNHLEMKLMTAVCDVSSTEIFNLYHNFFIIRDIKHVKRNNTHVLLLQVL